MAQLKIDYIRVNTFKPKEQLAEIEISFYKDDKQELIKKEYLLKNPLGLLRKMLLDIKSKDRIIFDDPTLDPVEMLKIYSPVLIKDEEETEEKIFNFIKGLCGKAHYMKTTKDAKTHMKLFDEFKTASLKF